LLAFLCLLTGCPPAPTCLNCGAFQQVGTLADPAIAECSGLVASQLNPGILWTHNDSGDVARLYAVREDGALMAVYALEGVSAVDWEDLAWGPCTEQGWADCLYVGDIGDNAKQRAQIQIYRVAEPPVDLEGPPVNGVLSEVARFDCEYPDGAHDAETLLVDPDVGVPYIVTKDIAGATAVYRFPSQPVAGTLATLEKVTVLAGRSFLTAGDVAPDASRVILRGYAGGFEYPLPQGGAFADMFSQTPCLKTLAPEAQGEALAIGPSGLEIFTASEGAGAPIHKASCTLF
jgi:hypothetical protein